jgi:cytochrome c biogenesis protein CcmG, thiol:disulfide interchange protein DsbE
MSGSSFSRSAESESASATPAERKARVWPWLALLVVVAMALAWLILPPSEPPRSGEKHPGASARIDEMQLEPLTGGGARVTAADLQGKVTLINFWGPWCPPCRVEFPHLMEIEQHFRKDERFQLLSISCSGGPGSDEQMGPLTAEFLEEHKATLPTYRDPHQVFARHLIDVAKLDGFVFPTSLVVDRHGVIRGVWAGYMPGDERDIHRLVESLLLKSP